MRILFTFENPLPNSAADAEVFVCTAAAMARRGHDCTLVVPALRGQAEQDVAQQVRAHFGVRGPLRIEPLAVPTRSSTVAHVAHATRLAAVRARADVVYTRNLYAARTSLWGGHRVFFEHYRPWGDQIPPFQHWIRAVMGHRRFVGMVAHSEVARRAYMRLGVPGEAIRVVHNGYDPARIEPRRTQTQARAHLGWDADERIVVYTGRINHKKGLGTLLAMARVLPDVRFVLVGSEGHGAIEAEARAMPNVVVVPWQDAGGIAPYLYAADVLIVPPSDEPLKRHGSTVLPLKLFLYLAAGRAILAADTPDVRELLRDDDNAALVRASNLEEATAALQALFADPERRRRLADRAQEDGARLTWDARAERIERVLGERLNASRVVLESTWSTAQWARECARWLRAGILSRQWIAPPP